ncbi:MAG: sigma-70 family RNA polymerase sigma factor [Oscillospiraceae bacterium]|nr:sigma-70 family RNA polymerase sigma factor [Oscillospiraceae bacterium]
MFGTAGTTGGDRDAEKLEELYRLHKNAMLYTANRILKDPCLAEDAVQKAFMRVLDNLNKVESADGPKTRAFLVIIVRNVAITMYNEMKKQAIPFEEIERAGTEEETSPYAVAASRESMEAVARNITKLGKKYADVLVLKFYHQYSDREIAAILGITHENVRVRLHRGREKLMALLREEELLHGSEPRGQ